MAILRATTPKKRLRPLGPPAADPPPSTTALGDWYVNRFRAGRQPYLGLVSELSLLPIVALARDVRGLPDRLEEMVWARLLRMGADGREPLSLPETEDTPCHASKGPEGCFWPRERTLELLKIRWS